jgi:hypothetical protein
MPRMAAHNVNNDVHSTVNAEGAARPRPYLRLSKGLAESYGMSYRQLWRKVKADPKRYGAQRREDGWYLPAGVEVERERAAVTWETEAKVKHALKQGARAAVVAQREEISEATVYKIKKRLKEEEEKLERWRREHPPELSGYTMLGGLSVRPVETSAGWEALAEMVSEGLVMRLGERCYFDPMPGGRTLFIDINKLHELDKLIQAREPGHIPPEYGGLKSLLAPGS